MKVIIGLALACLAACGDTKSASNKSRGMAACDEWAEKFARCANEKMTGDARRTALESLQRSRATWSATASTAAGQEGLGRACEQMLEVAREATSSLGCSY